MDAIETFTIGGLTVSLYQDDDAENPREWDHLGTMVCWHRRENLGDETIEARNFPSEDALIASLHAQVCLPLYLYDHGSMTMRTYPFGDPWDSGQVGFIFATAADIREAFDISTDRDIPPEVVTQVCSRLEAEVAEYDQYLTGDVYGFIISDAYGQTVDSCWGFFGFDYARREATAAAIAGCGEAATCPECNTDVRDDRTEAGMKCGRCAYGP